MKAKTWIEIKSMSPLELEVKLRDTEDKLFRLKFRHSSTPVKNGIEIRSLRRMVAKIRTLLRENVIRQGTANQAK